MPLFFLPLVVSYFNPHSPCGERRSSGSLGFGYRSKFQSTLPLRGATARRTRWCSRNRNFNPHSPCGERPDVVVRADWLKAFQSTLPLRGATSTTEGSRQWLTDFNPHSPCGERPATSETNKLTAQFQSTLPLRGATRARRKFRRALRFQSTLPLRGATLQVCDFWGTARMISIHTPLAGSDSDFQRKLSGETISIHTPLAGSDPGTAPSSSSSLSFQSTLPLRGATFFRYL